MLQKCRLYRSSWPNIDCRTQLTCSGWRGFLCRWFSQYLGVELSCRIQFDCCWVILPYTVWLLLSYPAVYSLFVAELSWRIQFVRCWVILPYTVCSLPSYPAVYSLFVAELSCRIQFVRCWVILPYTVCSLLSYPAVYSLFVAELSW